MIKTSKAVLAAILAVSGTAVMLPAPPAEAQVLDSLRNRQSGRRQQQQQEQQQQQGQAQIPALPAEENAAVMPLYTAVQAQDWATASAALPAAQAAVRSPQGRYLVGQLQLNIGRGTQNNAMQAQAVDAMIASGAAPAEAQGALYGAQAGFALEANNYAVAETALTRLVELSPNDAARVTQLAQVKVRLNKRQEALPLFQRALQLSQAAGQTPPEAIYRNMVAIAYEGRSLQPAMEAARTLVTNYPTAENWRVALGVYRDLGASDEATKLDTYRLMRAAGALQSERDYVEYAEAANRGAIYGEVKAALDAGLGSNAITAANSAFAREMLATANQRSSEDRASLTRERSTAIAGSNGRTTLRIADAFYGYGQYAEAAELYRAALRQGGVDANVVNTRLGAALAQAGQRAEAEAALRAVTGARADLANLWLLWLARRA